MLVELSAENIAIMDNVEVRFGPGFTAITGETGAGKSLLIDAISLCLGERADTTLVRKGATMATARAVFDAPESTRALLDDLGYGIGDDALYLQRDIFPEGKSVCRINGRTAPVGVLKQVGDTLVDLHGQHEHQSLLNTSRHIGMLDDWIGDEAATAKRLVHSSWELVSSLRSEMELLRKDTSERERLIDLLRHQVQEITEHGVKVGEIEALQVDLKRLEGAERLSEALTKAGDALFSGEYAASGLIREALRYSEEAAQIDGTLLPVIDELRSAELSIEEASLQIKQGMERVEFDPARIEIIAARLDAYANLRRKYGETEGDIIEFLEKAAADLHGLEHAEHASEEIEARLGDAISEYDRVAQELSTLRKLRAAELADGVQSELHELGMMAARFGCAIENKPPGPGGIDHLEFLVAANAGEDIKPLAKVASGGEMSRVMLAIKTMMAGKGGIPTLIFDEIDTGLGGQAAAIVAKKLLGLGENYQVLAITHVPQIAGKANAQISIEKETVDGRTVTRVRGLSATDRVTEIARMVGGEWVEEAAIANARKLLSD